MPSSPRPQPIADGMIFDKPTALKQFDCFVMLREADNLAWLLHCPTLSDGTAETVDGYVNWSNVEEPSSQEFLDAVNRALGTRLFTRDFGNPATLASDRREQIIDELVEDMSSWNADTLLEWAKVEMRNKLDRTNDIELVDGYHHNICGDVRGCEACEQLD